MLENRFMVTVFLLEYFSTFPQILDYYASSQNGARASQILEIFNA